MVLVALMVLLLIAVLNYLHDNGGVAERNFEGHLMSKRKDRMMIMLTTGRNRGRRRRSSKENELIHHLTRTTTKHLQGKQDDLSLKSCYVN